jgi:uncharacterized RDD family membrane protein YckC
MEWYYISQNQRVGPVGDDELERRIRAGSVRATTPVWREGQPAWLPYQQALLELPADQRPEVAFCSTCGIRAEPGDLVTLSSALLCPACKPVVLQRICQGLPALPTHAICCAGFTIRCVARAMDGVLWLVVFLLLEVMVVRMLKDDNSFLAVISAQQMLLVVMAVLAGVFETVFVTAWGATPGKMVCGLTVVRADGSRVRLGRAIGRYFAILLTQLTCLVGGIGFLMVLVDPQHRALHDFLVETRVIRREGRRG